MDKVNLFVDDSLSLNVAGGGNQELGARIMSCLPDEMIEKILDELDSSALLLMRAVSLNIKRVVDQPKYLQKIKIRITGYRSLIEILHSNTPTFTPWCNFYLGRFFFANSKLFINSFTAQFGAGIKICTIPYFETQNEAVDLFSKLTNLESLEIREIADRRNDDRYHGVGKTINAGIYARLIKSEIREDTLKKAEKNLMGVKHLSVESIDILDNNYTDPFSFDSLLKKCPNLVMLRLPVCERKRSLLDHLVVPLTDYLSDCYSRQNELPSLEETFKIDFRNLFCPMYYESTGYSPYFLDEDIFFAIVEGSHRIKAKLISVPYYFLPKRSWRIGATQLWKLNQVVSSVLIDPRGTPRNWRRIYFLPRNARVEYY